MRKRIAGVLVAVGVVAGMVAAGPLPVTAQSVVSQPFTAYGTGTALSVNALAVGSTQLLNTQVAFSGGSVNSAGLGGTINNQFGQAVQPPLPGKNAYGRGSGVELGLATPTPQATDVNQLALQRAEASAPPSTGLITNEIPINLAPLLTASTARGQAQATFHPDFCPIGRPLSFGLGYVENLQVLVPTTTNGPNSVLGTSATGNSVTQSKTVTYLVANGDGTYGVVSEVRAIVAPISVAGTSITIDVVGELIFRATATGKPGDPRNGVFYGGTPTLTVSLAGVPILGTPLTLNALLGMGGLNLPIPPLLTVKAGTPPTGITGTGSPVVAPDGTSASAAVDYLRLQLLAIPGLSALDLSIGHMETAVSVPAGGLRCQFPVSKAATPDPVPVGSDFTFTISIPSDPALFAQLYNCDLVGISAVDTVEKLSGNPSFQILSADRGVVSGNKVTFPDLGNYRLGDPPIQLTIRMRIPSTSGAGVIRDIVDVTATLGNCRGTGAGDDLVLGNARIDGSAITGRFVLSGPTVGGDVLAATGGTAAPLVAGGALVLGALGLLRLRRAVVRRGA